MIFLYIVLLIAVILSIANLCIKLAQRKWKEKLVPQIAKMSLDEINEHILFLFDELDKGFSLKKQFEYELFCEEKRKRNRIEKN